MSGGIYRESNPSGQEPVSLAFGAGQQMPRGVDMNNSDALYQGLQALANTSFPKKCNTCGKFYQTADQFVQETQRVRKNHSGLKSGVDDDGSVIVELFRNCSCGSTLMDCFNDRRDLTHQGERRRKKFGEVMIILQNDHGLEPAQAREEIFKILRGEGSEFIKSQ